MIKALLDLEPEIYGSIADPEKIELKGLHYIFQRLPQGIEECQFIKLISREGYEDSSFDAIIPAKRRRNCYRIDEEHIYIEMTRGRSDVYDVLTHLTFMYIEAEKIRRNALDHRDRKRKEWLMLEKMIQQLKAKKKVDKSVGYTYLSTLLGRTYDETASAAQMFDKTKKVNSLFNLVYWLGHHSIEEHLNNNDREISFSSTLREKLGMHIFGEAWAQNLKRHLDDRGLLHKEIHVVSANLHSVMNSFYAVSCIQKKKKLDFDTLIKKLSIDDKLSKRVHEYALKNGMTEIFDKTGTNIGVQVFDCSKLDVDTLPDSIRNGKKPKGMKKKVIVLMDYAFGEQAYECMDELLKPFEKGSEKIAPNFQSINIMGKAGILHGNKGDIIVPSSHVFEGTADNYPFENSLKASDFKGTGLDTYTGAMITVLGTSLQNKDILRYFLKSSWKAAGLEMEGAHYQKAIQAASKIRNSVRSDVVLRYAYYASDNPLETGSTLASGGLGMDGVKPTYAITSAILKGILLS